MKDKSKTLVVASFVADSLALGPHWMYDTKQLKETFGRVETLRKPTDKSPHAGKDRGEFTHYGDQMLVLLESVAARKGFDPEDFGSRWKALFEGYEGYFDQATLATLDNLASGKGFKEAGSSSLDLAGGVRIAPLVHFYHEQPESLVEACQVQTKMTHNRSQVIESSIFFARITLKVLQGESPVQAIQSEKKGNYKETPVAKWVEEGLASASSETSETIARFGQACHTEEAFPCVIHLIARYENDFKEALIENVMAGGDSAARGMAVAMVLGAHMGQGNLPQDWITGLKGHRRILELLGE